MDHLELDDLSDPESPDKVFEDVVYLLQRENASKNEKALSPDSIKAYARHFRTILFDTARGRVFVPLGNFTKKKQPAENQQQESPPKQKQKKKPIPETPEKSFSPDTLNTRHESRAEWGDANRNALIAELEDSDPDRAEQNKNNKSNVRGNQLAHLDPILTPSSPEVLSRHMLAQIELLLTDGTFIPDPLNRLTCKIAYHVMLYARRDIDFICNLRVGQRHQVLDGPVIDLDAGVIYHVPKIYFGRSKTVIKKFSLAPFLDPANGDRRWADHFEGYTHSAPVGAVPLPQQLLDEISQYRQMLAETQSDNDSATNHLLHWQDEQRNLVKFETGHFKEFIKNLNAFLAPTKSGKRSINMTRIKNCFDAYLLGNGLPHPDYWHITERARYVFEMPTRYTLRPFRALATTYFLLHNQFQREIQAASNRPLGLTLTDPSRADDLPDLLLGSLHALEEAVVRQLANFFLSPAGRDIYPKTLGSDEEYRSLTTRQRKHNGLVWETIFWCSELLGLRDFEIHRLEKRDVNFRTESLIVDGRGRRKRELPLHPVLRERFEMFMKKRHGQAFDSLFWLYASKSKPAPLQAVTWTKSFFAQACERIGWPQLNFGANRHRFRTELALQGILDNIINYLMGHDKSIVGDFSRKSLDRDVRAAYLAAANQIIKKYNLIGD